MSRRGMKRDVRSGVRASETTAVVVESNAKKSRSVDGLTSDAVPSSATEELMSLPTRHTAISLSPPRSTEKVIGMSKSPITPSSVPHGGGSGGTSYIDSDDDHTDTGECV